MASNNKKRSSSNNKKSTSKKTNNNNLTTTSKKTDISIKAKKIKQDEINEESLKIENELEKIDKELEEIKEKTIDYIDKDGKEEKKDFVEEERYDDEFDLKEKEEDIEEELKDNQIEDKHEEDITEDIENYDIEDERIRYELDEAEKEILNEEESLYQEEETIDKEEESLEDDTDILEELPKNVKEEEKKKPKEEEVIVERTSIKVISFIIALILVSILGYFVYDKYIKVTSTNISNDDIVLSESQIKEIGKTKFQFLSSKHDVITSYPIFFKDSDVTIDNIDANQVLSIAYNLLSVEDKNYEGEENKNCYLNDNITMDNYPEKCHKESFSTNLLKEKLNSYFSNKLNVEYKDFTPTGNLYCNNNNNKYTCYLKHNDLTSTNLQVLTSYDVTTMDKDKLYIYSYLLTVKRNIYSYKEDEQGIYNDINATNKIDDLKYYNEIMQKGLNDDTTRNLLGHYKDKITKYKSVFQKEDGDYVWVGTYIEQN